MQSKIYCRYAANSSKSPIRAKYLFVIVLLNSFCLSKWTVCKSSSNYDQSSVPLCERFPLKQLLSDRKSTHLRKEKMRIYKSVHSDSSQCFPKNNYIYVNNKNTFKLYVTIRSFVVMENAENQWIFPFFQLNSDIWTIWFSFFDKIIKKFFYYLTQSFVFNFFMGKPSTITKSPNTIATKKIKERNIRLEHNALLLLF